MVANPSLNFTQFFMTLKGMENVDAPWPQAASLSAKELFDQKARVAQSVAHSVFAQETEETGVTGCWQPEATRLFKKNHVPRCRGPSAPLGCRSFTVIELTVTLTILAVIFLAVHGVLARTLSSKQKAEKANRRATISDAILRRMAADLRSAFMASTHEVCFKGDSESLHFVTSVNSLAKVGQQASAFNSVGYVLGKNEKSSFVFRLFRRESRGEVDLDEGEYRELYAYAGSIKFEYLQRMDGEDDQDAVQVKEDWDSIRDRGLPIAVQMEMTLFFPDGQSANSQDTFAEMDGSRYRAVFRIPAGGHYIPHPDFKDEEEPAASDATKESGQSSN